MYQRGLGGLAKDGPQAACWREQGAHAGSKEAAAMLPMLEKSLQ
jgi:hypothetical protein